MRKTIFIILGLMICSNIFAQVPPKISYSGKIVDKNNNLLPDGKYDMKFSLFTSPSGGVADWTEQHLTALGEGVTVTAGGFDVTFGKSALPDFSTNYYLQTEVYINSIWESFGRREFKSVAYARRAEIANGVADNCISTSKIIDGAITASKITTLPPITGGMISSSTITGTNIASATITGGKIAANTITNGNIAAGAVNQSNAPFAPTVNGGVNSPKIIFGFGATDPSGNATISLAAYGFTTTPAITCTAAPGGGVCRTMMITAQSSTGFSVDVRDDTNNGNFVVGFNWIAIGY